MSEKRIKYEMKKVAGNLVKHFGMYVTKKDWEDQCQIEINKAFKRMEADKPKEKT